MLIAAGVLTRGPDYDRFRVCLFHQQRRFDRFASACREHGRDKPRSGERPGLVFDQDRRVRFRRRSTLNDDIDPERAVRVRAVPERVAEAVLNHVIAAVAARDRRRLKIDTDFDAFSRIDRSREIDHAFSAHRVPTGENQRISLVPDTGPAVLKRPGFPENFVRR